MGSDEKSPTQGEENKAYVFSEADANERPKTIWSKSNPEDGTFALEEGSSDVVAERGTWSNQREFLLSCIAMSVGLGNVWRFPVTAYENGGGAFLIPYFIVLLFIGRPIYFLELCVGQFTSYSQIKSWKSAPIMKGVGWTSMVAMMAVLTYYCSIMALTVYYFIVSFQKTLPWTVCDPEWEKRGLNYSCAAGTNNSVSTAEMYYLHNVIKQKVSIDDGIGTPDWKLSLCLLFCWATVMLSLIKGVKSSGKVAYFTALFPYVVLLILLIRGVTLPGAAEGIRYFVEPQWKKLLEPNVWYAAVSQCFFSLNTGFGSLIMFASYNPFHHNIYRDAIIVSAADTFTSLISGITIFAVLGNLADELGVEVESVVQGGNGLAFINYPQAIAKFDWAPQFFAVLFFLMLFTLGLGSTASDAGAVVTIFCDLFPSWKRWKVDFVVCTIGFLTGLIYCTPGGQYMLDLVDFYGGTFIIYVASLLEVIAIAWIYGLWNFIADVEFMTKVKLGWYWKITWGLVIPVGLSVILVYALIEESTITYGDAEPYPTVYTVLGILIAVIALLALPTAAIHAMTKVSGTTVEKFWKMCKPSKGWGPRNPIKKQEWIHFKEAQHVTTMRGVLRRVRRIFCRN